MSSFLESIVTHPVTLLDMTSSLRNSIHRRNHKERSQLAHRSRLGILEKHADYVKRARDYHSKQDRLNRLKQKAAERNKDEFYFSMRNEKTKVTIRATNLSDISLISPFSRMACMSRTEAMSPFRLTLSRFSRHRTKTTSVPCVWRTSRSIQWFLC